MNRAPWLLAASLLLAPLSVARGAPPLPESPRPQALALLPAEQPFFLSIEVERLRRHGPAQVVAQLDEALAPRLASLGLAAPRLRAVLLAGSADGRLSPARRRLVLVLDEPGAAPELGSLRAALGDGAPATAAQHRGVPYQRGPRLSAAALPEGPTVLASSRLLPAVLDRWLGGPAVRPRGAPPRLLLQRLAGPDAPSALFSLWLRPSPALKQQAREAGAPASPLELAAFGRAEGQGVELRAVAQLADGAAATALRAWLQGQLLALADRMEVQLLGLSPTLRLIEVGAGAPGRSEVTLRLPLSRGDYGALLSRLVGLGGLLSLRRGPGPT